MFKASRIVVLSFALQSLRLGFANNLAADGAVPHPIKLSSVDISPWLHKGPLGTSQEDRLIETVRQQSATYGAIFIHGIPASLYSAQPLLKEVFNSVPQEEKSQYHVQASGFTRGFVLPGRESGSQEYMEVNSKCEDTFQSKG